MSKKPPKVEPFHDPSAGIARQLVRLRKEVGMTLKDVAEKTGLSGAYLSRVENGQAAITIKNLSRVATAFATPISAFFADNEPPRDIVICRKAQGRAIRFRGKNSSISHLLAEGKGAKLMEPLIAHLHTARNPVPLKAHPGEEFNYVLSGECTLHFGSEEISLHAGDAVYFNSTVLHGVRSVKGKKCELLVVVSSHDFSAHSNIGKILEGRIQA